MPTLEEALADHVEELIAVAQFAELGLFQRRPSGKTYEADGAPASVAVLVDTFKAYCGPDWKAMVLRLVEIYRKAQKEGDYTTVWLFLREMVQTRWAQTMVQPSLGGSRFEPDHAAKNAGLAAGDGERDLATKHLGLHNGFLPRSTRFVTPQWWEALEQSGKDPRHVAIYFVNRGGQK